MAPTPHDFFKSTIHVWEDMSGKKVYSSHPSDRGNYLDGRLVGSQHGVTGAALAAYRGVPNGAITADVMKKLTLEEAADIGMKDYFYGPGLDKLRWGPAVASITDWGWMSGPRTAIRKLQKLAGTPDDGAIGPNTIRAVNRWLEARGAYAATRDVKLIKDAFFRSLGQPQFLDGWLNRSAYYDAGTAWFKEWA